MPLYEYECPVCGKIEEEFRKISERNEEIACHTCKVKTRRIFSYSSAAKPKIWKLKYSHALGRHVKNKADFVDGLKRIDADHKLIVDVGEY